MAKLGNPCLHSYSHEDLYGIKIAYTNEVKIYHLKSFAKSSMPSRLQKVSLSSMDQASERPGFKDR